MENTNSNDLEKLAKDPVIKIMQAFWGRCAINDQKTHSKQTAPADIKAIKDIQYEDNDIWHRLDVYYPSDIDINTDKLPVVIDIHGGGWMYATKELNEYYCKCIAKRGYTVFSMNYRLVPDVTVEGQLSDVMSAIDWIFENMSSYPADQNKVMLTGDSAGGQLASYAAVLLQSQDLKKIFSIDTIDRRINALLLTSPVAYMRTSGFMKIYTEKLWGLDYKKNGLYQYMDISDVMDFAQNFPPTYLITSSGDILARSQTHRLYDLLEERAIKSEIVDYPAVNGKSLPHVFNILDPFSEIGSKSIDAALEFYNRVLRTN